MEARFARKFGTVVDSDCFTDSLVDPYRFHLACKPVPDNVLTVRVVENIDAFRLHSVSEKGVSGSNRPPVDASRYRHEISIQR
ncbi:MAG: hypothetical protein CME21_16450 [Gemmatimonadetes bacterium]|nr:hypothetical protein [Gemmatimonadota bacterium]